MSSALRVEQPRSWWSLSSKSSKQDLHKHYANDKLPSPVSKTSSGRSFPSFSSVIGRKSKKHPTLAIEEPPSPLKSSSASRTRRDLPPQFHPDLQGKSPFRSSQPLSPAESVEPLTPVDGFREGQQSLLALDNDPFMVQSLVAHGSTSTSGFSTHSNSSFLDVGSKPDKSVLYLRTSYSSSSSNSHSTRESQPQNLTKVHNTNLEAPRLSSSKSTSNLKKNTSSVDPQPLLPIGNHSQPNSRPPTRSRGMTESDSVRPPFLQDAYATARQRRPSSPGNPPLVSRGTTSPLFPSWAPGSQPSSRPSSQPSSGGHMTPSQLATTAPIIKTQTITRQTSIQRLQPPTAPPTHELPPPPSNVTEGPSLENQLDSQPNCSSSISLSSSNISFISSTSSGRELVSYLDQTRKHNPDAEKSYAINLRPEPGAVDSLIHSPSRPLPEITSLPRAQKQVPSHCSPSKRLPSIQPAASTSSEPSSEAPKVLRKPKSHHRLGLPPISLGFKHGHTVSASTPSSPQLPEPSAPLISDSRCGSTISHASVSLLPVRKRVFSGSSLRRPSTSSGAHTPATDDDARSLFSLRSDHEIFTSASPFKPWPANMSTLGSFWEDHPPSPTRSDYLPQPIISPEALAQMEADLEDGSPLCPLPPPSFPLQCRQEQAISAPIVLSDRDSEVIPSSEFSEPLSEVLRSPQLSVRSIKSITVPVVEVGNLPGTGIGRTTSLVAAKTSTAPQLSRRPATASGTTSLGPVASMSTIHEPGALRDSQPALIDTRSPVLSDTASSAPISPLSIKKSQRKHSNASSTDLPPLPLRSLPPPPRPRAKAEVVTVIDHQPKAVEEPQRNSGGTRNSIGVDFGHGQRYGHVVPATIQSNAYHLPSQLVVKAPTASAPPVPPRASSRPLPPSYRQPRQSIGIVQKLRSNPMPPNGSGGQKLSRKVSLQKKPSFLDIDDDDDAETNRVSAMRPMIRMNTTSSGTASFSRSDHAISVAESFLEFGRESFDTIRSADLGPEKF